ncbi:interferon lambda receptor 1 isoform X1 [Misgurnus anguillicaudatus]|uniref:interferon lambda receptor 1 isoform X1 n=2 Tax=Misgurnus anguillicaudatus TaxID=75329 RepID=UPI003CCFCB84
MFIGSFTPGYHLTAVDMWSLSAVVLLLCFNGIWCDGCNLTKPYFESRNFHHVLHWNEVDIPEKVVLYSIQYTIYGEPYKPAIWCQNITAPQCDLTSVMTDVTSRYHAKITVDGLCVGDIEFIPYRQTILEAPDVSVSWNETSLNVTILPPMGPDKRSMKDISCWGICQHPMKFTVKLTQPKFAVGREYKSTSDSVLVWPVEKDTKYCGDVVYSLTHPMSPRQSDTKSFCVTTSASNTWFHLVLMPALLAVLLLIILSTVLCQQSMKGKRSWPKALVLPKKKLSFYSEPLDEISKVQVCPGFVGNSPNLDVDQEKSKVVSNCSGYASQNSRDLQWTNSDEEMSADCSSPEHSVNYTMVVGVRPPEESSDDDQTHETISELSLKKKQNSDSVSQELTISDSINKPLVVPVIPDANGLLQFKGFLFQPGSESLLGDRTPLLTDLIIEDSSCNSTYRPVNVSDFSTVTSNYRQNWLPGTPLEGYRAQRTYVLRKDPLRESTEKEHEDLEIEEESKVCLSLLDRWMLKMEG